MKLSVLVIVLLILNSGIRAQENSHYGGKDALIAGGEYKNLLPISAGLPDGSAFVSWFRSEPSGYKLYMQYLDKSGLPAFGKDGLLVSGHPQPTSLSYYDLKADSSGAAVIFTDIRGSGNLNVHAYKISPEGKNLWGENGLTLSEDTKDYKYNPLITGGNGEGYFAAWSVSSENSGIEILKLDSNGRIAGEGKRTTIRHNAGESLLAYKILNSDSGGAIILYGASTGMYPNMKTTIYVQKADKDGRLLWGDDGVVIHDEGKVNISMTPSIVSDNHGGAIIAWYSAKYITGMQSVFVQRINSDGKLSFEKGGITVTDNADLNQFYPTVIYNDKTDEIITAWTGKNGAQSLSSLMAQRISPEGKLLWGGEGLELLPMAEQDINGPLIFIESHTGKYSLNLIYGYRSEGKNHLLMQQKIGPMTKGSTEIPDITKPLSLSSVDSDISRLSGFTDKSGTLRLFWEAESRYNNMIMGTTIKP